MLVLSRRPCQRVVLPELEISISVVSVQGQVVRLGIEAPPAISVFREEVLLSMDQEHSQRRAPRRFRASESLALHCRMSGSE
jgi:carbon storage regulator